MGCLVLPRDSGFLQQLLPLFRQTLEDVNQGDGGRMGGDGVSVQSLGCFVSIRHDPDTAKAIDSVQ